MTRILIFAFLFLLTGLSCLQKEKLMTRNTIALLPFKDIDTEIVINLRRELARQLTAEISILPAAEIPGSAWYPARQRYLADSLLAWLLRQNKDRYGKIVAVTSRDISSSRKDIANWGVMGMAWCPGQTCVISSFRIQGSSGSKQHFIKRMTILALHELGHAWSLPHCGNNPCLMRDAEGKMNLDNTENYCPACHSTLRRIGVLR